MLITEVYLKNYRRFSVSNIKEFNYKPIKKQQIILGTNGSGKSSLLKELIPNVDREKQDFYENGKKIVKYKHNGSIYTLSYDKNSNNYSFVKDGKEFNQSHNKTMQKQLIETYFRIDSNIFKLLIGEIELTTMSIQERREWFLNILTHIDYKYALDVFNTIKTELKDTISYIKLTESKLKELEKEYNSYKEEDIDRLKRDKKIFEQLLNLLYKSYNSIKKPDKPDTSYIEDITDSLFELLTKYDFNRKDIKSDLISLENQYKNLRHKLEEIDNELRELDNMEELNIDRNKLEREINVLKREINNEISNITQTPIDYRKYLEYLYEFNSNQSEILPILMELERLNSKVTFNLKDIDKILESLNISIKNLRDKKDRYREELSRLEGEIDILEEKKSNEEVICPNCKTKFIPGSNDKLLNNLKDKYKEVKKLSIEIENRLKDKESLLVIIEKIEDGVKTIKTILRDKSNPFYILISRLTEDFLEFKNISIKLQQILNNIRDYQELEPLINKYYKLEENRKILENISIDRVKYMLKRKNSLLILRSNLIDEINTINRKITELKDLIRRKDRIVDYNSKIRVWLENINNYRKLSIEYKRNMIIGELIEEIEKIIRDIDNRIMTFNMLENRISEYREDLDKYMKDKEVLSKLSVYISPQEGLIGETMINTINLILERINNILEEIWIYPIELLPFDLNDGVLDFKFKTKLNNTHIIDDIRKGSSSIKEVINLAFKITAMEFLDITSYPLILDEYGKTMDEIHRIKAYEFIDKITRDRFSQVFIVSHYESMYGRFSNADVVILDNNNINFNQEYNKVVDITR